VEPVFERHVFADYISVQPKLLFIFTCSVTTHPIQKFNSNNKQRVSKLGLSLWNEFCLICYSVFPLTRPQVQAAVNCNRVRFNFFFDRQMIGGLFAENDG
jgi:hypothetical protein